MGGINAINRRRPNLHRNGRLKTSKARTERNKTLQAMNIKNSQSVFALSSAVDGVDASLSGRRQDGLISTRHHRKMLLSDPNANIELSKKKRKKILHQLKMVSFSL